MHDTVRRIVLGRPQEQINPWRWAVTFRTTNWNMSLTDDEGPQLIMNNVTGALLSRQRECVTCTEVQLLPHGRAQLIGLKFCVPLS